MAKAAVHQLTYSLASDKSGLPANSTVLAVLPYVCCTSLFLLTAFSTFFFDVCYFPKNFLSGRF